MAANPWKLYDAMIAEVPTDVLVRDYCIGPGWCYVEADSGMGFAYATSGGNPVRDGRDFIGQPLADMARLAKAWNFRDASLGVAALNAWYAQPARIDPLGAVYDDEVSVETPDGKRFKRDSFQDMRPAIAATPNAKVVVVGHFPHVERLEDICQLTVLERNCRSDNDIPDPACEYVIPEANFAFITGVTLINKTAPRLLDLAKDAVTIMVGPSVVPCQALFDAGVEVMGCSIVADPERARFVVKTGQGGMPFKKALRMATIESAVRGVTITKS